MNEYLNLSVEKLPPITAEQCETIVNKMYSYDINADNRKYSYDYVECIVMCDVQKIDDEWKKDKDVDYYITPNNPNDFEKYVQSRENLITGKTTKPPTIYFNDKELCFGGDIDTRYIFANLRDCGQTRIPIVVEMDEDVYKIEPYLYTS